MGDHMFHDLELSREFTAAFHAMPSVEGTKTENLTVMVLQRSFWPFSAKTAGKGDVILPKEVCLLQ
jgi:cullin-4